MKTKPAKPDPIEAERTRIRTFLQSELVDFENQKAQFSTQVFLADGAIQATRVALKKLDEQPIQQEAEPAS